MDPVSAIGLVASVLGVTDIIARSLKGLRTLQTVYSSADTLVIMIVGYLHTVRDALDEISEWARGLQSQPEPVKLLAKIDSAVVCCATPLSVLRDKIEELRKHTKGDKLASRGKLAYMLGEGEIKLMSVHLSNQVQALNLLMTAARCKNPQECNEALQNEETQTILRLIQDDSNSYKAKNPDSLSVITKKSLLTEHTEHLDAEFNFDDEVFSSQVYKNAYRMMVEEHKRLRRRSDEHAEASDQNPAGLDQPVTQNPEMTSARKSALNRIYALLATESPELRASRKRDDEVERLLKHWAERDEIVRSGSLGTLATESSEKTRVQLPEEKAHKQSSEGIGQLLKFWNKTRRHSSGVIDRQAPREEHKILLLGAGASGRDTLLKNFRFRWTGLHSQEERDNWKEFIFSNLVQGVRVVLEAMESLEIPLHDGRLEFHAQIILVQPRTVEGDDLPAEVGDAIFALREDAGFRECLARSREYQLFSSFRYLLSNTERIIQPGYIPSHQDLLHTYVRTTGISETTLPRDGATFYISNVGGYRSERKKWIRCFEDVTAIIFTVDISEYDLLLFEDETVNRAQESLTLFDSIATSRWLVKTEFVLLFTKVDLLAAKLPSSPLRDYFPDYEGVTFEGAKAYLRDRYVSLFPRDRSILHTNFVNLTDMESMERELDVIERKLRAVNRPTVSPI